MSKSIIRLTLVITAVISVAAILTGCGSNRPSENMDLKRSLYKLTKHFPEYDGAIVFFDAIVEDDAIVVFTSLDHEFYGSRVAQGLDELWHDPEWKEEFKEKMVVKHSHLLNLAKSAGIDLCWRFMYKTPGDGFDIRLNADEADSAMQSVNEKYKLADDAHNKLYELIKEINSSLPVDKGDGLMLKDVELQPNLIIYNYEVDENITSHKKIEAKIIALNSETTATAMDNGISGDSLLLTAAKANVGIVYRFSGNKSKYRQDYDILNATELRELAKQ